MGPPGRAPLPVKILGRRDSGQRPEGQEARNQVRTGRHGVAGGRRQAGHRECPVERTDGVGEPWGRSAGLVMAMAVGYQKGVRRSARQGRAQAVSSEEACRLESVQRP